MPQCQTGVIRCKTVYVGKGKFSVHFAGVYQTVQRYTNYKLIKQLRAAYETGHSKKFAHFFAALRIKPYICAILNSKQPPPAADIT